jgi:hypothetical protein
MPWLLLLKRFWPAIAVTLALLAGWLWHVSEIKEARADERAKVTAKYQAAHKLLIERHVERLGQTREKYANRIEQLRQSVSIELSGPPIRMCNAISVRAPEGAGGPVSSPAGGPTVQPSVDLRPRIVQAGETCERMRQQLIAIRALQAE